MGAFTLQRRHEDYYSVLHDGRCIAILFPARPATEWLSGVIRFPAEPWSIIPDPAAFPDAACTGLPRPLSPVGNKFATLADVEAFLGIPVEQVAA